MVKLLPFRLITTLNQSRINKQPLAINNKIKTFKIIQLLRQNNSGSSIQLEGLQRDPYRYLFKFFIGISFLNIAVKYDSLCTAVGLKYGHFSLGSFRRRFSTKLFELSLSLKIRRLGWQIFQ